MSKSPTVSPFLKDCTVHIPYLNAKTFADDVLPNHVGDKELKSFGGIRNEVSKRKTEDLVKPKGPNVSPSLEFAAWILEVGNGELGEPDEEEAEATT
ncbi:hypothetical protein Tco_0843832 [Tanacetum coccineum]